MYLCICTKFVSIPTFVIFIIIIGYWVLYYLNYLRDFDVSVVVPV